VSALPPNSRGRIPLRRMFAFLRPDRGPLELQVLGRTLLHAALVGAAAGFVGAAFFAGLEYMQKYLLEDLTGYVALRAHGETFVGSESQHPFRPWLLVFVPAVGALAAGWVMRFAPETRGGGGDAMIKSFHHQGGVVRRRVAWVKMIASMLTLGTGGSGGREGPTMQIGAALGSMIGWVLKVATRERRILMVAGVAAGMAAVFRTPLGAALLAVEVLYRDDFESDALIPAILASVVAYSIVISMYGESTLFARAPRYPFYASHLPLYALLSIFVALLAALFVTTLHGVESLSAKLPVAPWARPGVGGLALGLLAVPIILFVGPKIGAPGQGLGILGGGYGAAQMAITGAPWLPGGWSAVELLLLLCFAKMLASSLTIGSGGSAGDFAPSLVLGGIFGGAFGRAAQLIFADPSIDPGAFALVGMGTFYGGIAHVPVTSLVIVSELAGSYDLLVPMMLSSGIAFVALRRRSLYRAQVANRHESPIHRREMPSDLRDVKVADVMVPNRPHISFTTSTPADEVKRALSDSTWQDAFPVLDEGGTIRGLITSDTLRFLVAEGDAAGWVVAADLMQPPVLLRPEDDLLHAARLMLANGLRDIPVVNDLGQVVGFVEETDTMRVYAEATAAGDER
jgi:chloride channel protein, CIC family